MLLGVCLGKKAWSKHHLKYQAASRSQRVNIYFQPKSHFPDLGHFYSQIFKCKIAENHPAEKISNFRHFKVHPAQAGFFTEKKVNPSNFLLFPVYPGEMHPHWAPGHCHGAVGCNIELGGQQRGTTRQEGKLLEYVVRSAACI